ncbi:MAG: hypothetical protein R3348_07475, partial [Xanthomonadales bacterium]|nr:hypothetical protein [Xanthomonadales bacterium]
SRIFVLLESGQLPMLGVDWVSRPDLIVQEYTHITARLACLRRMVIVACLLAVTPVSASEELSRIPVNIFGDGDELNGVEDERIDMASPDWNLPHRRGWNMSGGTVHCDGRNRGSAVILDTSARAHLKRGLVLATAAHVVFDLENGRPFQRCRFHYMALDRLPGYQATIDLENSMIGPFDAHGDRRSIGFGRHDWAFLYVPQQPHGVTGSSRVRPLSWEAMDRSAGWTVELLAYNRSAGSMNISAGCSAVESQASDLGGGAWPGQLLDDCDSESGASGGGLIGIVGDDAFLVAIRSGAHWNSERFPEQSYPQGPPRGAPWSVRDNTNYARALDDEVLAGLDRLVDRLLVLESQASTF